MITDYICPVCQLTVAVNDRAVVVWQTDNKLIVVYHDACKLQEEAADGVTQT